MMLTDLITKTPDGDSSPVIEDKSFKFVFNALADRPETVAGVFFSRGDFRKTEKGDINDGL